MGWMQKLYATYEECFAWVGEYPTDGKRPLLPICHITKDAHVEVVLDEEGNLLDVWPITNKTDVTTIIPATEDSANRTSTMIAPHPLVDDLRYVAGDYVECGGDVLKSHKKKGLSKQPYRDYRKLLSKWCNSEFAHIKAVAVLKYIEKETLVKDLAHFGILYIGDDGKFLPKKEVQRNKDTQDIYATTSKSNQEKAVVRWIVETDDGSHYRTWHDESLWQSWIAYDLSTKEVAENTFCYVTGKKIPLINKHPKYIRKKGDMAKLISSNKEFTYLGKFVTANEACPIGLETSHKAHNVLSWLIDRQGTVFQLRDKDGKRKPSLAVVAWELSAQKEVPQPTQDTSEIWLDDDLPDEEPLKTNVGQRYAERLRKKIRGYKATLETTKWIYILAIDSLSQGRMAITYYQEFHPEDYLENIEKWHQGCAWRHEYLLQKNENLLGQTLKPKVFFGAPAPRAIAEIVHGKQHNPTKDGISPEEQYTISRLLPCIVEGRPLPRDIVNTAVRRASNRIGLYDADDQNNFGDAEYTWHKTFSIACALYRKYTLETKKEDYTMSLDPNRSTRDYLYGRLLAIADALEAKALYDPEKKQSKRSTNAARYMQRFSQRPYDTWLRIHDALSPYIIKLGDKAFHYQKQIGQVSVQFDSDEFKSNAPLTGEYLIGYYSQWLELRPWAASSDADDSDVDNVAASDASSEV